MSGEEKVESAVSREVQDYRNPPRQSGPMIHNWSSGQPPLTRLMRRGAIAEQLAEQHLAELLHDESAFED